MRILFVLKSGGSSGELQQAMSFANQLDQDEYESYFFMNHIGTEIIHGRNIFFESDRIITYATQETDEIIKVVDQVRPDLVICNQQFNVPENFREYLSGLNICKAGIDGSGQYYKSGLESGKLFGNYTFMPCPVSDPQPNQENVFYWNIYPGVKKSLSDKAFVRENFKLREESKIILFSIAPWAYIHSLKYHVSFYYNYIFSLLFNSLAKLPFATDIFIVSSLKRTPVSRGKFNAHFLDILDNKIYDRILMGADLFISDSLLQNSLTRAFMAGINTLSLVNRKDYPNPPINLFKFDIFPLSPLLPPLPEDSRYLNLLPKAEIFEQKEFINTLEHILTEMPDVCAEYRQDCQKLRPLTEILKKIL